MAISTSMPATAPERGVFALWASVVALQLLLACTPNTRGTIGAILARGSEGRTFVRDTPPSLAAYGAGIRPGDELLFVNGIEVRTLSDTELQQLLGGMAGQEVQLTLVRGEAQVIRVTVARSPAMRYP